MRDYREVVLQQLENLYTDDSSNRFNGNKQCFMKNKIYEQFKKCLVDGNSHLCKWAENDSLVQNIIDEEEDKAEGMLSSKIQHGDETYVQNLVGSSSKFRKVFGSNWKINAVCFVFEFANIIEAANRLQVSKRNILKISAMFFDPLGIMCSIVLNAKVFFQETCKLKLSLHAVIPIDIKK